jgi:hypothetical protein
MIMKKAHFSAPGVYRIEVQGHLDQKYSEHFGSMQIVSASQQERDDSLNQSDGISVLQGRVDDQAELSGILNALYEFHLSLLTVKYLGDE